MRGKLINKSPSCYNVKDRAFFDIKEMTEEGSFTGYAAIFGKKDLQNDVIEQGAFSKTIRKNGGQGFPVLWQHNPENPIGKTEVNEDDRGLKAIGKLALGMSKAKDAFEAAKAKIIGGLSIGFNVIVDELDRDTWIRHIKEVALFEVSFVTFPAQPLAKIRTVKSLSEKVQNIVVRVESDSGDNIDKIELFKCAKIVMSHSDTLSDTSMSTIDIDDLREYLEQCYRKIGRTAPWEPIFSFSDFKQHFEDLDRDSSDDPSNLPNFFNWDKLDSSISFKF